MSEVSTFDQIIEKKLPLLNKNIQSAQADLFGMVNALAKRKAVFQQSFIEVKKETEDEMKADVPNPKLVAFSERLDLI